VLVVVGAAAARNSVVAGHSFAPVIHSLVIRSAAVSIRPLAAMTRLPWSRQVDFTFGPFSTNADLIEQDCHDAMRQNGGSSQFPPP